MNERQRVLRVLRRARKLIARPYGWTKKSSRRYSTRTDDNYAYCATGAIDRAASITHGPRSAARIALEETAAFEGLLPVVRYNDDPATKKADILALFDKAINRVETQA